MRIRVPLYGPIQFKYWNWKQSKIPYLYLIYSRNRKHATIGLLHLWITNYTNLVTDFSYRYTYDISQQQGFFLQVHIQQKANFESAENDRSSNVVEFEFELGHIPNVVASPKVSWVTLRHVTLGPWDGLQFHGRQIYAGRACGQRHLWLWRIALCVSRSI